MKQMWIRLLAASALAAALLVGGCARSEGPAAGPAATATPVPTPVATGDLAVAKDYLDRAASELRNRNYRGSIELLDLGRAEVAAAAANAADRSKTDLEGVAEGLGSVRALLEKRDKHAEAELTKVYERFTRLIK